MLRIATRRLATRLAPRLSQQWEDRCSRCGMCCHEKTIDGRDVYYDTHSWCEHYDPETKSCRIYKERFEQHHRCKPVGLLEAMFASYLPESCAYVQWAARHHLRWCIQRRIHYVSDEEDTARL